MKFRILREYTRGNEECEEIHEEVSGDIVNAMMKLEQERERHPNYKLRLYKEVTSEDY